MRLLAESTLFDNQVRLFFAGVLALVLLLDLALREDSYGVRS